MKRPPKRQETAYHSFAAAYGLLVTIACQAIRDGRDIDEAAGEQHTRAQGYWREARTQGIMETVLWNRAAEIHHAICREWDIKATRLPPLKLG